MTHDPDKSIRLSQHALEQCPERGTTPEEVEQAVRLGLREPAKKERWMYRHNLAYNAQWRGRQYSIKQVAPVVVEELDEFVVITVYTFFF